MSFELRSLIKVAYPEFAEDKYSIFTDKQLAEMNQLIMYADYYDNNVFKYIEEDIKPVFMYDTHSFKHIPNGSAIG